MVTCMMTTMTIIRGANAREERRGKSQVSMPLDCALTCEEVMRPGIKSL